MEAPHDYKYECSSEVFIVDDSVVLLLQNVAVVVFRAGNDCTLEKSRSRVGTFVTFFAPLNALKTKILFQASTAETQMKRIIITHTGGLL